jgi:organic radical activating enzyme
MNNEIVAINRFGWEASRIMFGWDLGRRCNYDCSYCPSHRHNNYSPHASLDDLVYTFKKLSRYRQVMAEISNIDEFTVSITGGEPAANPVFWKFCKEMNAIDPLVKVGVTTNGTIPKKHYENIDQYVETMTISYHCEADDKLKKSVIDAILYITKNTNTYVNVNVMFHSNAEYFQECLDLCFLLEDEGVNFVPRIIGEDQGTDGKKKSDKEFHSYTKEQTEIFTTYYQQLQNPQAEKASFRNSISAPKIDTSAVTQMATRNEIGRPCCGGITFNTITEEKLESSNKVAGPLNYIDSLEWDETKFLQTSKFKNWSCLVHLFLPHLQQETRMIYAHQTCQANEFGRQGPLCTIETFDAYIDRMAGGDIPVMKCPNNICNCGICTPKSKHKPIVDAMVKKLFTKIPVT